MFFQVMKKLDRAPQILFNSPSFPPLGGGVRDNGSVAGLIFEGKEVRIQVFVFVGEFVLTF